MAHKLHPHCGTVGPLAWWCGTTQVHDGLAVRSHHFTRLSDLEFIWFIWGWVKTLVPSEPQNSWDLWMFIPLKCIYRYWPIPICFFGDGISFLTSWLDVGILTRLNSDVFVVKKSVDWPAMLSDAIHFWKHAWFWTLSPAPFISLQNSFMLCNNLSQASECLRLPDFLTCSFFTFRTRIKLAIPIMIYNILCMYMCFPICPVLGFPCQATLVWGPNSWHKHSRGIV